MILIMLPELGHIGPLTIKTYTILLDLVILIGLGLLAWRGKYTDAGAIRWLDTSLFALLGGIIGGRLEHVVIHYSYFYENPSEIVAIWNGGLGWHGAILVGLVTLAAVHKFYKVRFRQISDVLSLILPFSATLLYTGCLMNRCSNGREIENLASYPFLLAAELPDLYGVMAPRLNSQLFGIILCILLLAIAIILARLLKQPGIRFWIVLSLLGAGIFGIGFTRGDSVPMMGYLRLDQILDLIIVVIGLAGMLISLYKLTRKKHPGSPPRNMKG